MKHSRNLRALSAATLLSCSAFAAVVLLGACASTATAVKEPVSDVDLTKPPPRAASPDASAGIAPSDEEETSLSSIFNTPKDEGLTWTDTALGNGQSVQLGDLAKIHYIGRLADGTEFDNSHNRPGAFEFSLGHGMVIKGFERGMVGMRVGGSRTIHVPWKLAYGVAGNPPRIPPKSDLTFEIELIDIPVPIIKDAPKKSGPSGVGSAQ